MPQDNSTPAQPDKDVQNKLIQKERDRNRRADEYNDKKQSIDEGQWPDWYQRARK